MMIYIPSRARAAQVNHTFDHLPPGQAVMVVSKEDAPDYIRRFGKGAVLVTSKTGIGPVRQWIMNHATKGGVGKVCMMDDDLRFFVRRTDEPEKLIKATTPQVSKMLSALDKELTKYAHASVAAREGANRDTRPRLYDTRMLRVLAYNVGAFNALGVKYDRCPVMEDFDVTLQLLEAGFSNVVLNDYAQDQGTSNAPGGCSTYRTADVQTAGANRLKELHPDFVTVVTKETKGAWGGGERTDVRIAWKKARGL